MLKKLIRILLSIILIMIAFGLTIMQRSIIDTINNDWVYANSSNIIMIVQILLILIAVINMVTMLKHIKVPVSETKFSQSNKVLNNTLLSSAKLHFNQKQKRVLDKLNSMSKK